MCMTDRLLPINFYLFLEAMSNASLILHILK